MGGSANLAENHHYVQKPPTRSGILRASRPPLRPDTAPDRLWKIR